MNAFSILVVGAFVLFASAAFAGDPRPAPGSDPGGVAVAIISDGLDYTQPGILTRLARDGEGEIVGFDFVDDDRYPFRHDGEGTAAASVLIAAAPQARLAPVRATTADPMALGRSAAFAGQSPARIALVTLTGGGKDDWEPFRQAARRFSHVLFVVSAGGDGVNLEKDPRYPASLGLGNVLVVAASDGAGKLAASANRGAKTVDIAAPGGSNAQSEPAARVAALAARVAAAESSLGGADLKARIMALAAPLPGDDANGTRGGWIGAPERLP